MIFSDARGWLSEGRSGGASITSSYSHWYARYVRWLEKTCDCPIKHVLNWKRVMTWETWSKALFESLSQFRATMSLVGWQYDLSKTCLGKLDRWAMAYPDKRCLGSWHGLIGKVEQLPQSVDSCVPDKVYPRKVNRQSDNISRMERATPRVWGGFAHVVGREEAMWHIWEGSYNAPFYATFLARTVKVG